MALSDHLAAARALIAEQYPLGAAHEPQQPLLAALVVADALEGLTGALEGRSGAVGAVGSVLAAQPPEGDWIWAAERMPTDNEQQGGMVWSCPWNPQLVSVRSVGFFQARWKPFRSASDWITHRTPQPTDGPVVIIPTGDGTTVANLDSSLVVPGQPWAACGTTPGPYPF